MDDDNTEPREERRRAQRAGTAIAVTLREAGQQRIPAQVTSFSRFGCRIEGATLGSSEKALWVRLPDLESQSATIRWTSFGCCGVEFERPLHPAVACRFMGPPAMTDPLEAVSSVATAAAATGPWPDSRRQQILQGHAEPSYGLLSEKTSLPSEATLSGLIRRHRARVSDHRREPRYPAPAKLREMTVQGRPTAVIDISSSGIRFDRDLAGTIGDVVPLSFPDFEAIAGTIVWTGKGATGVALPSDAIELIGAA